MSPAQADERHVGQPDFAVKWILDVEKVLHAEQQLLSLVFEAAISGVQLARHQSETPKSELRHWDERGHDSVRQMDELTDLHQVVRVWLEDKGLIIVERMLEVLANCAVCVNNG